MNDEHGTLKRKRSCDIFFTAAVIHIFAIGRIPLSIVKWRGKGIVTFCSQSHQPSFLFFNYSKDQWLRGNSIVMTLYSQEPAFKLFIYICLLLCTKESIPHCNIASWPCFVPSMLLVKIWGMSFFFHFSQRE